MITLLKSFKMQSEVAQEKTLLQGLKTAMQCAVSVIIGKKKPTVMEEKI